MLVTNACGARPTACTPTFLPFKSRMLRMPSCPNSSKQPTCTPPTRVSRSPASIVKMLWGEKCREKSTSPRPSAPGTPAGSLHTYWTSIKPSARSSWSATYWGAQQMPALFASRMVVVSGGLSWADEPRAPMTLPAPADASMERKRRRLCVDCITCLLSFEVS